MDRRTRLDDLTRLARSVLAGARGAEDLWRSVNKNGRVTGTARTLLRQMRLAVVERDPSTRLTRQLDAIDAYLLDAALPAFKVGGWRDRSAALRRRVALLKRMPREGRGASGRALESEVAALFAALIAEPTDAAGPR